MLTRAEKINRDTAIEKTVRKVRRLLRSRFFSTSIAYFIAPPPDSCAGARRGGRGGLGRFHSRQHALVEPVHGIDVALGARVVRDHHDSLVKLAVKFGKQIEN